MGLSSKGHHIWRRRGIGKEQDLHWEAWKGSSEEGRKAFEEIRKKRQGRTGRRTGWPPMRETATSVMSLGS